jgi:hypothetical protein
MTSTLLAGAIVAVLTTGDLPDKPTKNGSLDYEVPAAYSDGPPGIRSDGFRYICVEQEPPADQGTCPCLDTFWVSICDVFVRMLQSAPSAQLRKIAPTRVEEKVLRRFEIDVSMSEGKVADEDKPLTDDEMQEMLESTELLEEDLEGFYYGPDEPLDESVLGPGGTSQVCPFQYPKQASEQPTELTVTRAPHDLVLEEESEVPTTVQRAHEFDLKSKVTRVLYRALADRMGYMPLCGLSFICFGQTSLEPPAPVHVQ